MTAPADITFVDHAAAPGGAELSLARYLRWAERGHRVNLVLFTDGYLRHEAERAGIEVIRPDAQLRGIAAQRAWLKEQQLHFGRLVVSNSLNSAIALATLGKQGRRWVYYLREDLSPQWLSWKRRFVTTRLVLPRFDAFIANSRWTASTIPSNLSGKPSHVCYPVCGVADVQAAPQRLAEDRLHVVSLSRLAEWKGVDVVIEAVDLARGRTDVPIELTLAGADLFDDGEYSRQVYRRAEQLTPPAQLPGHVDDVPGLLADAQVLVHASRRAEPFGQVIVQGLSAGLGVIATRAGGPVEVISEGESGLLVAPDSPEEMADALVRLANEPELRARLSAGALARALDFTDDAACRALEAVLTRELVRAGEPA